MYSTIQMAKKPAIIATIAATPPFVTKEVAADEVVGVEAAELAVDPGPVVVAPLEALGLAAETLAGVVVLDAKVDAPLALALALPELAGVVNETGLGVALGPVGAREAIEEEEIRRQALKQQLPKKIGTSSAS